MKNEIVKNLGFVPSFNEIMKLQKIIEDNNLIISVATHKDFNVSSQKVSKDGSSSFSYQAEESSFVSSQEDVDLTSWFDTVVNQTQFKHNKNEKGLFGLSVQDKSGKEVYNWLYPNDLTKSKDEFNHFLEKYHHPQK